MQRKNSALTDCDAAACYDIIIPILLYIYHSKAGLPHFACIWLCKALITLKYHVTTVHGVSEDVSEPTPNRQILGIGQGAIDEPSGWLFVLTLISKIQNDNSIRCTLTNPSGTQTLKWTYVMFVDDAYLMHTCQSETTTAQELMEVVTGDVTEWSDNLDTMGGKLEAKK